MGSKTKKKTTMAKLNRENAVRERRLRKQAKKDARKQAAAAAPRANRATRPARQPTNRPHPASTTGAAAPRASARRGLVRARAVVGGRREASSGELVMQVERRGDPAHLAGVLGSDERRADTAASRAAGAAHPMHVALAIRRRVEVDHVGDAVDVDPAGCDVRRHQRPYLPGLEARERPLALALGLVAVHGDGLDARPREALHEPVGAAPRAHEDQREPVVAAKLGGQRGELVLVLDREEAVRDGCARRGRRHVLVADRVARVRRG